MNYDVRAGKVGLSGRRHVIYCVHLGAKSRCHLKKCGGFRFDVRVVFWQLCVECDFRIAEEMFLFEDTV